MSGILDFDLGNSRLKWRFQEPAGARREGVLAYTEDLQSLAGLEPQRVRIASVVKPAVRAQVEAFCQQQWKLHPELAKVEDSCAGVRQGYRDGSRLGVDRWLAMLAAFQLSPGGAVVVSCGTAITVDLLAAGGQHLGGYIVPGLESMRSALFAGTSAVKLDRLELPEDVAPGRDTMSAVSRGLIRMVGALVEGACAELSPPPDGLWLTGGDAELLLPFIKPPQPVTRTICKPNLVLDGLALALP